jgi:phosphatidylinositol kinase/protein kinase (PI-3  family)
MFFISGFDLYRRSQRNVKDILHSYLLATHYDPNWYKAWHTWALANFEVVNHLLNQAETKAADVMGTTLVPHIVPAVQGNVSLRVRIALIKPCVQGFFRSIALRSENSLQDTLRLLTLWFKFGAQDEVSHAIASGFSTVEVDTWLEVIPQVCFPVDHFRSSSPASHRSLRASRPLTRTSGGTLQVYLRMLASIIRKH